MFIQKNLAFIWFDQSDHHIKCGCFSRSVGSQQTNDFALFDVYGNMVNHGSVVVAFNKIVGMYG